MSTQAMFSSNTPEWATPQSFFDELDREFHFSLDPCCTHDNAKCTQHYTREDNGLLQDWGGQRILDTHLGSGSSRIAAYHAGLDFYGCELDKEYFDKANERFQKEIHGVEVIGEHIVTQQSLF